MFAASLVQNWAQGQVKLNEYRCDTQSRVHRDVRQIEDDDDDLGDSLRDALANVTPEIAEAWFRQSGFPLGENGGGGGSDTVEGMDVI